MMRERKRESENFMLSVQLDDDDDGGGGGYGNDNNEIVSIYVKIWYSIVYCL